MPERRSVKPNLGFSKKYSTAILPDIRIQTLLVALAYFITARLSLFLAFEGTNVSPVWPPSGLAFAAVLMFGRQIWPGIFIGVFLANSVSFMDNLGAPAIEVCFISFLIAIGNTLEALVGYSLFKRFIPAAHPLERTKDVFVFLGIALLMCLIGALNGPVWLCLLEYASWDLFYKMFFTWWTGDVTGILTVMPIVWAFFPPRLLKFEKKSRAFEYTFFIMSAMLINDLVFGGYTHVSREFWPLEYLVFPVMIWGSCRFMRLGVGITTLITTGYSIWGTLHGYGPFGGLPTIDALILMQALVGMISLTGMSLTAALEERNYFIRELEQSKKRFEMIFENSPIAKMIVNTEGRIEMFNRMAEQMFGYKRQEILGKNYDLILPELVRSRPNIRRKDFLFLSRPQPMGVDLDLFAVSKDGQPIAVELGLNPIEIDGKMHILSSLLDISLRKKSERILKEREAHFRTMADHAPVMIWMAGTDAKCYFFNKSWLEFTGRRLEEESGDGWSQGVFAGDLDRCVQTYQSAFGRREKFTMDYRLKRSDGQYRWILDSGVPLYSYDGAFMGYIGSCVDITDLKEAQEILTRDKQTLANLVDEGLRQLIKTKEKLEQSNRLAGIGTLAATVAHELRNPLGVIQMASYNLKRKNKELENSRHLQNIDKKIFESNQIINNLLNYSSIKQPQHALLNICGILDECAQTVKDRAADSKIFLSKEYPADRTCLIEADPLHVREIFNNILMNAVQSLKDHQGEILIRIVTLPEEIKIGVTDNGEGIEPGDLAEIFEPFFTKKSKGTGLGLTICNELVNMHNGKINIDSTVGQGTTVTVTLPKRKNNDAIQ